jgi:nucleotide-binding universal stress UspA family protein
MTMTKPALQILLCADLRQCSTVALRRACQLAARLHARPLLGHIAKAAWPLSLPGPSVGPVGPSPLRKRVEQRLQQLLRALGLPPDIPLYVRFGRPIEGLLSLIDELKPDLVVVCHHRPALFKRPLLGDVARGLAARSPVPILIVPTPAAEPAATP